MKTQADIETALQNEITATRKRRFSDIYTDFNLWYLPHTASHDGALLILSEPPANPEWVKAKYGEMRPGDSDTQNFNRIRLTVLPSLPIMGY